MFEEFQQLRAPFSFGGTRTEDYRLLCICAPCSWETPRTKTETLNLKLKGVTVHFKVRDLLGLRVYALGFRVQVLGFRF